MQKIQRNFWWSLLGIALLIVFGISSCSNDSSTSPDRLYDLEVELVWDAAVNMDLWIIEPTGKGSGHGDPGNTAHNTGNNDCGFGSACLAADCSDLPCNTPERIYIDRGEALPESTEPFHHYELGISNWSSETVNMILFIRTSSESRTFYCTVDGPRVSYIADITFPNGTIAEVAPFIENYCQE